MGAALLVALASCSGTESGEPATTIGPGSNTETTATTLIPADETPDDVQSPGAESATITIVDFRYPTDVVVPPGGEVTWVNETSAAHSVVFDARDGEPTDQPDLELAAGTEATATLARGAWSYHCGIHERMSGTLLVDM